MKGKISVEDAEKLLHETEWRSSESAETRTDYINFLKTWEVDNDASRVGIITGASGGVGAATAGPLLSVGTVVVNYRSSAE